MFKRITGGLEQQGLDLSHQDEAVSFGRRREDEKSVGEQELPTK